VVGNKMPPFPITLTAKFEEISKWLL
jgi:hypothetical protein